MLEIWLKKWESCCPSQTFSRRRQPQTQLFMALVTETCDRYHGSHCDCKSGKTWKNGKVFSSRGKVGEFCQDWKSQVILLRILEKLEKIILEN